MERRSLIAIAIAIGSLIAAICLTRSIAMGGDVLYLSTTTCVDGTRCTTLYGSAFSVGTIGTKTILVTARHNLPRGHGNVVIQGRSSERFAATHTWSHPTYDFAFMEVSGTAIECFKLASRAPAIGAQVTAGGFPERRAWSAQGTRAGGRFRNDDGTIDYGLYAISISCLSGASGGPVTDSTGCVVGLIAVSDHATVTGVVSCEYIHESLRARYGRVPTCGREVAPPPPEVKPLIPRPDPIGCDCADIERRLAALEKRQGTVVGLLEKHDERIDSNKDEIRKLKEEIAKLRTLSVSFYDAETGKLVKTVDVDIATERLSLKLPVVVKQVEVTP